MPGTFHQLPHAEARQISLDFQAGLYGTNPLNASNYKRKRIRFKSDRNW